MYVPEYNKLIKERKQTILQRKVYEGKNIVIYDYDGPKKDNGEPDIIEINKENLIND